MTHQDKIDWMVKWAHEHEARIELKGECGFGRECVGLLINDVYPDYIWYDDDYEERLDENGEVWCPEDAYHKHPCVAVLGRGEEVEAQLYDWIKWFDENGFTIESTPAGRQLNPIEAMMGKGIDNKMVKAAPEAIA